MKTKLSTFKETISAPLRQATLCFLVRDKQVLLAMKKRGFAQGKWNGAGGKMDERDKTIEDAAIRETAEEIGVLPNSLEKVATLDFYHEGFEGGQKVTVYLCREWGGEPSESEEMAPKWFSFDEIPYQDMWEDDKLWLPRILKGEKLEAEFLFDENQNLLEQHLNRTVPEV